MTPLTPLDLYPQCLLKVNLKQIIAIPPSALQCAEVGTKAELLQVGTFFPTQFPSLGIFINTKVGNRKKLRPPKVQLNLKGVPPTVNKFL